VKLKYGEMKVLSRIVAEILDELDLQIIYLKKFHQLMF